MNYFDYVTDFDRDRALRIYTEVYKLTNYAKKIYKGYWEDALDNAFFHILENFKDDSGGDLEHYATKVVNTICLGRYSHEIAHDTSLNVEMDKKSANVRELNPLNILTEREESFSYNNLKGCINYLLPKFIQDSQFFITKKAENRKCSYSNIFSMFSSEVIVASMNYLANNYGSDMERLSQVKKKCKYRNFQEDRYKSSMDCSIEYMGTLKGVILYKSIGKKTDRYFYEVDILDALDYLVENVYNAEGCPARAEVEGINVYCTLSGQFVSGEKELRKALENELIGTILARLSVFKVVVYERGKSIVFSASREVTNALKIEFLDDYYYLDFKRIPSKRVNNGRS